LIAINPNPSPTSFISCFYSLSAISRIFRCARDEPSTCDLHNKYLFWHGTKISNLMSILQKGLQVSPFNVERSGSMFGKVCVCLLPCCSYNFSDPTFNYIALYKLRIESSNYAR